MGTDDQHFAGFDVTDVGGANQVERAGLGADDPGVIELAERERPEPVRIAHRDHAVLGDQRKRKRPGQLGDRFDQGVFHRPGLRPGIQVQHHFSVAIGLED